MMTSQELSALTAKPKRRYRKITDVQSSARLLMMARRLYEGGSVSCRWVKEHYGVSYETARRDIAKLESYLPTERAPRARITAPITVRLRK